MSEHVGVVIPTRGRPELLQRAIRTVWSQDHDGRIDVTVVVDHPDEPLPDLEQPTSGLHRLEVIRNAGTPGLAGARNFGLGHVEAPLLALLDDDDEWHPTRLSRQVALLRSDTDAALAGGGICIVQPDSETERVHARKVVVHEDLLRDRIAVLHPSTYLLRTALVREVGGWDESIPGGYAEDYDLLLRLTRRGHVVMAPTVVARVHWAGHSYFFSRWAEIAAALEVLLAKHPDFAEQPRGQGRILGQIAFAQAASQQRRAAWATIRRTVRTSPQEPRLLLAALVALQVVSADRIQQTLHRRGRGL